MNEQACGPAWLAQLGLGFGLTGGRARDSHRARKLLDTHCQSHSGAEGPHAAPALQAACWEDGAAVTCVKSFNRWALLRAF